MTEILILDYNRADQLEELLVSIQQHARFDKKVVVLNNGGEKYADKFLALGLCDKVIHNEINVGCGAGSIQLFAQCQSKHAFYVQVDHVLAREITQENINKMSSILSDESLLYVDLAGRQCGEKPSERAGFWDVKRWLSIPKTAFGPGPWDEDPWTEECIQKYAEENNLSFPSLTIHGLPPFLDRGMTSVRSNPDGSEWMHYPDTKRLFCLRQPLEKFKYPKLTDEEWEIAISGEWPEEGLIPEKEREHSFEHWNKFSDRRAVPCNLRSEKEH